MKKVLFLSLILVVSFLLVGCTNSITKNNTEENIEINEGNTLINFKIDWDKMNSQYLEGLTKNSELTEIDLIGIRIVYNNENINITQSISKEDIENNVLKKQLPISDDVSIYLVYLSDEYDTFYGEDREFVRYIGVLENTSFNNKSIKEIDLLNDFEISNATWSFLDSERQKIYDEQNKIINKFDSSEKSTSFFIKISYPFKKPDEITNSFVWSRGFSGERYIEDNNFVIEVVMMMPESPGEYTNFREREFYFQPFLFGQKFGLSQRDYLITPENNKLTYEFQ